jgi:exosortase/archaeosortase family protein
MNRSTRVKAGGLALAIAAVMIWLRDFRWWENAVDTLPLAFGLPLAWHFGRPWKISEVVLTKRGKVLSIAGAIVFAAGWIGGNCTLLSFAWTLMAAVWAYRAFEPRARRGRLVWLLLFSFPWLVLDWQIIGWWFRISSAAVTELIFHHMQMPVIREGTSIAVLGVPVEIEAACAGWNLLQLTLLAGVAMGTSELRSGGRFAVLLAALPVIAWLANLLRILVLTGIALSYGTGIAKGAVHGLTGLAILAVVLVMTKLLCYWMDSPPATIRHFTGIRS